VQVEGAGGLALARAVKGARHMLKLDLGGNTLGSPIAAELGGALPAYIGTRLQVQLPTKETALIVSIAL
jgi:hypothetical protein